MSKYYPPSTSLHAFNCPHCKVYAQHYWFQVWVKGISNDAPGQWLEIPKEKETLPRLVLQEWDTNTRIEAQDLFIGRCHHCKQLTVWIKDVMIYPALGTAPQPNEDLSADIRQDYEEAASICLRSPRGAAALLRLAMQKLCGELGLSGETLNENIGEFVKKGLDQKVQKAMDYVRVTGNDAVHPGQIDLNDNPEIAGKLFDLVNVVAQAMISQQKMVEEMYESLPEVKKDQIKQRDKK
ncbi:MAG: DUF4145 domain-containing protein [Gammaproteobacteria bacterium]|nr:DUF4145 domain-containing protein [Gammaproteobacteria bacterium]MYF52758.1 DUF4145 domain-containing protein [Gammaproteobacteria bacterium]MYK44550.1 DUF4145 domain-containing protein [Gammaproteobacteria bacterium]